MVGVSGALTARYGGEITLPRLATVGSIQLDDPTASLWLDARALATVEGSLRVFSAGPTLVLPAIESVGGPHYPDCTRSTLYVSVHGRDAVDPDGRCDWDRQPAPLEP